MAAADSTGGDGGLVTVTNNGSITATGLGARGIYAQSLGGGGGDGGDSSGIAAFGGSGSATSDGKAVQVRNNGNIISSDSAIFAQSLGGGGGNGGSSTGWFSMGGSGGSGGDADRVTVSSHGNLTTFENNANAIFAQSLGGGGGNGGNSTAVGAFVAVAVGGSGEKGGFGSSVQVGFSSPFVPDPVTGSLTTWGMNANGILAQSVGGGGGNGGFAVSAAVGIGGAAALGLGGKGGGGNNAADVQLLFGNASSQIVTFGENSNGIFAQSVGGGGGTGGMSIAAAVSNKFTAAIALGGDGGTGGHGSVVFVGSAANPILGNILTFGNSASGILAQSVGGGGGKGGVAIAGSASLKGVNFAMGGSGLGGGNASFTSVTNGAFIQTTGTDSHGIFAQSVGGGGGGGGFAIAAGVALEGSINVGLGGSAGPGGNGGTVVLQNNATSSVNTWGNHSNGLFAQSVGGGGGDGGFAIAGGVGQGTTATFGIGGSGAAGGFGSNVQLTNNGLITTHGEISHGIFAQSQGGGGGSGGFALAGTISTGNQVAFTLGGSSGSGGAASTVNVTNTGSIVTGDNDGSGKGSYGISAQSVGGGGGSGGFAGSFTALVGGGSNTAVSLGIGGDGSGGGAASTVTVNNSGSILTQADASVGIFAQAIGGGGGDGGFALAFSLSTQQQGKNASLTLGGKGGVASDGATVSVTNSNTIVTVGNNSQGIQAQSVGGGGGNGGFAASVALGTGNEAKSLSAAIGGTGGAAGDGKDVWVTNNAVINTSGDDSSAILAQSIGKGGGNGGFSFAGSLAGTSGKTASLTIGGFGGGGGKGDAVNIFGGPNNQLTTFGDRSHGVEAESIGGGGGNGGFAISGAVGIGGNDPNKPSTTLALALGGQGGFGNTGGTVNVGKMNQVLHRHHHHVGQEAVGILAQSVGTPRRVCKLGNSGCASIYCIRPISASISIGMSKSPKERARPWQASISWHTRRTSDSSAFGMGSPPKSQITVRSFGCGWKVNP